MTFFRNPQNRLQPEIVIIEFVSNQACTKGCKILEGIHIAKKMRQSVNVSPCYNRESSDPSDRPSHCQSYWCANKMAHGDSV